MAQLVLVRHGQSTANLANIFTGWLDVPLTTTGEAEAAAVATRLRGFRFDEAYTSCLVRAQRTLGPGKPARNPDPRSPQSSPERAQLYSHTS